MSGDSSSSVIVVVGGLGASWEVIVGGKVVRLSWSFRCRHSLLKSWPSRALRVRPGRSYRGGNVAPIGHGHQGQNIAVRQALVDSPMAGPPGRPP